MYILVRVIALLFHCAPSVWRACTRLRSFWTKSVKFSGDRKAKLMHFWQQMNIFPWLSNIYRWRIYLWNVSSAFRKRAHSSKQHVSVSGTHSCGATRKKTVWVIIISNYVLTECNKCLVYSGFYCLSRLAGTRHHNMVRGVTFPSNTWGIRPITTHWIAGQSEHTLLLRTMSFVTIGTRGVPN